MEMLFKTYAMDIKQDAEASRRMTFTISTSDMDRDGDIIDPKGWDTESYMKNPCVLFAHDYSSLPVAKAVHIETTDKSLIATAEFPEKGVYSFADTVYDLLKGGFLNATSVGFKPLESEPMKSGSGKYHKRQSLLEWSIVPIPANPHALVMQRHATATPEQAVQVKALVDWSEKFLADFYGERGVWLPASQIEKAFDVINKSGVLIRTPNKTDSSMAGATSTGEPYCEPKAPETIDFEDGEMVLELSDEVIDIDPNTVSELITHSCREALTVIITDEMRKQLNYARGRVE